MGGVTCREWLGFALGWCPNPPEAGSGLCLEHIAERQVWQMKMDRRGVTS